MSFGRVMSTVAASAAVAGCAVIVVGMARAQQIPRADPASRHPSAGATRTEPTIDPSVGEHSVVAVALPTSTPTRTKLPTSAAPSTPALAPASTTAPVSPTSAAPSTPARTFPSTTHAAPAPRPVVTRTTSAAPRPAPRPAAPKPKPKPATGSRLPLSLPTYNATRVITVRSDWSGSTTAVLQAWTKAAGGGWLRYGASVIAHVGADGIGQASESTSRTPAGSFTLTQAFGHYANPGTSLPYVQTTPSDWWISQEGPLYNTHQRCSYNCAFDTSRWNNPNEHLYYETPYYNYAAVIDYNTRNSATGVQAGRGSAFFLHVTDGRPTAGCVAVPQDTIVSLLRWLTPSAHPRILIGVS